MIERLRDVAVVNAGTGNLRSVVCALNKCNAQVKVIHRADDLLRAERIVLPGVGAFGRFIQGLRHFDLVDALTEFIRRGRPLLGICVGMQALLETSSEMGSHMGLGMIPGHVVQFPPREGYKIPHTGWNQIWFHQSLPLLSGLKPGFYAYFNHSYYCEPHVPGYSLAQTDYGVDFTSIVGTGLVFGVQFHPEKSQAAGERLLSNFLSL